MSPVPLPVAHIARNMGLSRQNVQRLTNELEAQGVIRFTPNPQRAKLVLPAKQGRLLYEIVTARQRPWASALADGLPTRNIEAATELLRIIRSRLGTGCEDDEDL